MRQIRGNTQRLSRLHHLLSTTNYVLHMGHYKEESSESFAKEGQIWRVRDCIATVIASMTPRAISTMAATHCNTLQHTATHCNTLQHTAPHCNTLQHTATHCNTLQHTAISTVACTLQSSVGMGLLRSVGSIKL